MKGKKLLSGLVISAMSLSLIAPINFIQAEDKKEIATLRWLAVGDGGAKSIEAGDRIIEEINNRLGINLVVERVPQDGQEKINLEMSSSTMPDLVTAGFGSTATQNWIDKQLLVPLNDYFDDNPVLKEQLEGELAWTSNEDDNLFYGMPFITQYNVANTCLTFRGDWLDKFNLTYPKNFEEVEAIFDKFTNEDPDGNGQKDTYGITMQKPTGDWSWVFAGFGIEHGDYMLDEEGKVIPAFEHPYYKEALEWIKKIYDAGYVDKEFVLNDIKSMEEKFFQGKAGSLNAPLFRHVSRIENSLKELNPDARIEYGSAPEGPHGHGNSAQGKNGLFTAITTSCAHPEKAAAFINFMISDEGKELVRLGIEGVHYTKDGDKIVYNEEERAKDSFSPNGWAHPLAWGNFFWPLESNYLPETEPNRDRALESIKFATQDQRPNLIKRKTREETEYGKELGDIYESHFMSILNGEVSIEDGLANLSSEWRAAGGDEVIEAAQKAYEEQNS